MIAMRNCGAGPERVSVAIDMIPPAVRGRSGRRGRPPGTEAKNFVIQSIGRRRSGIKPHRERWLSVAGARPTVSAWHAPLPSRSTTPSLRRDQRAHAALDLVADRAHAFGREAARVLERPV